MAPAAPGVCAHGGVLIQVGRDDNNSGSLEAQEIAAVAAVCNGSDGVDGENGTDGRDGTDGHDGEDGKSSLLAQTAEPPGAHCPLGGVRIDSGLDDDRDGHLAPDEVDATSYVCAGQSAPVGTGGTTGSGEGAGGEDSAGAAGGGVEPDDDCPPASRAVYLLDDSEELYVWFPEKQTITPLGAPPCLPTRIVSIALDRAGALWETNDSNLVARRDPVTGECDIPQPSPSQQFPFRFALTFVPGPTTSAERMFLSGDWSSGGYVAALLDETNAVSWFRPSVRDSSVAADFEGDPWILESTPDGSAVSRLDPSYGTVLQQATVAGQYVDSHPSALAVAGEKVLVFRHPVNTSASTVVAFDWRAGAWIDPPSTPGIVVRSATTSTCPPAP